MTDIEKINETYATAGHAQEDAISKLIQLEDILFKYKDNEEIQVKGLSISQWLFILENPFEPVKPQKNFEPTREPTSEEMDIEWELEELEREFIRYYDALKECESVNPDSEYEYELCVVRGIEPFYWIRLLSDPIAHFNALNEYYEAIYSAMK